MQYDLGRVSLLREQSSQYCLERRLQVTNLNTIEPRTMITDAQRHLINYWKLRSEQSSHNDDTARERLTNAFRIMVSWCEKWRSRATFELSGTSHLEGQFWISATESTDSSFKCLQSWYYTWLAQFSSVRHAYEDVRYCIKQVGELDPDGNVRDPVRNLGVGSDVREFWRSIVATTPANFWVEQLEAACWEPQFSSSSNISMSQSLMRGNRFGI